MAKNRQRLKHNCVRREKIKMQLKVKNPGKQRKRLFNAPAHIRHKLMAAPLSKELAEKQGIKTLPVRKGDTVHIQRGDNKGFEGKISRVDLKSYRIYIEGLTREKVDGSNIFVPIHPSKVMIKNLSLDDDKRKAVIGRKKPLEKATTPKPTKQYTPTNKPKQKIIVTVEEETETAPKPKLPKAPKAVAAPVEKAPKAEKKPAAKKAAPSKPAAAKAAPKKEKAAAKEEDAESKPRAKPKAPKKTEGGQ
jgi:large subunit ribosomal protein L24